MNLKDYDTKQRDTFGNDKINRYLLILKGRGRDIIGDAG